MYFYILYFNFLHFWSCIFFWFCFSSELLYFHLLIGNFYIFFLKIFQFLIFNFYKKTFFRLSIHRRLFWRWPSSVSFSKKEVFQPHLPVRLPCYDLAPVTSFTLGRSSRLRTSGTPGFHGLTGGVYKARERIHRAMADARLLANPASWSRVADFSPNWDQLSGFAPPHSVAALCTGHCNTCVAPDVRAVLIWRHPHLPLTLRRQSP